MLSIYLKTWQSHVIFCDHALHWHVTANICHCTNYYNTQSDSENGTQSRRPSLQLPERGTAADDTTSRPTSFGILLGRVTPEERVVLDAALPEILRPIAWQKVELDGIFAVQLPHVNNTKWQNVSHYITQNINTNTVLKMAWNNLLSKLHSNPALRLLF